MVKYKRFDGDLQITTNCPIDCDFCIYSCNMKGDWMPEYTMRRVAEEFAKNDVGIRICGGEPFLDFKKLGKCIDICLEHQAPHEILNITSAFFGVSKVRCEQAIQILSKRNLDTLVISSDRFHLKKVPFTALTQAITECNKQKIKPVLRITLDDESTNFIPRITEIIAKHNVTFELHSQYGIFGKAELLDSLDRSNDNTRKATFMNNLRQFLKKYQNLNEIPEMMVSTPKREQRGFAGQWYPTAFPNGDVFADSQSCKATLMGNINTESLQTMIDRWSQTLPGSILWSKDSNCVKRMRPFLPPQTSLDECDYCRNHPLEQKIAKDAIGREYIQITMDKDLDELAKAARLSRRELLICFDLKEKDLNRESGKRIQSFLEGLQKNNVRFVISRTLPRCLFGANYNMLHKKFAFPRNCYECHELFGSKNGRFHSCKPVNAQGPQIGEVHNRDGVFQAFREIRNKAAPCSTCRACTYFKRNLCDGICHREYASVVRSSQEIPEQSTADTATDAFNGRVQLPMYQPF